MLLKDMCAHTGGKGETCFPLELKNPIKTDKYAKHQDHDLLI